MQDNELNFPCEYPVRVIGLDEDGFADSVIAVIRRHVPDLLPGDFSTRLSGGEKYISVSVKFIAESRQQVDALYAELAKDGRVKVAF